MKKIFFIFILLLSFFGIDSAFALGDYILYNNVINQTIYKKLSSDTSNGSQITSSTSSMQSVCSDWLTMIYQWSWNNWYIKNVWDSSAWSVNITETASNIRFSPDCSRIIYVDWGGNIKVKNTSTVWVWTTVTHSGTVWAMDWFYDWHSILYGTSVTYKKDVDSSSIWTVYINYSNNSSFVFSKDTTYLYYRHWYWGPIYKKLASDTSEGVPIFTWDSREDFDISPDWTHMIYTRRDDNMYLWEKDLSDWNPTSYWVQKNSSPFSFAPKYNGKIYIIWTCHDGIKNQDETAIDFWGVCGTGNVSYDSFGCINQSFVNPSDITWYSWLYAGTWSLVNPPIFTGSISAYYWTGVNHDILMIYDYPFNISAPDDKAFEYWLGRETYFEGGNIRTWSVRWWTDQQFNAVAIYWTWTAGRGVFKHSTDNSNMFTTVGTSFNGSGAVYWIDSTALSNVFDDTMYEQLQEWDYERQILSPIKNLVKMLHILANGNKIEQRPFRVYIHMHMIYLMQRIMQNAE